MLKKIILILIALLGASLACNFPGPNNGLQPDTPVPTSNQIRSSVTPSASVIKTPEPALIKTSAPTVTPTYTQPPRITYQPSFEAGECRFPVPAGYSPECGDLIVPEDRSNPDTPYIRLHVAVFRSISEGPAHDPVFYLSGGPGSSALETANYLFSKGIGSILDRRDLVFFDQRGTGYSQPSLKCPERDQLSPAYYESGLPIGLQDAEIVSAFTRCRDRLISEGVNLGAYNSAASAADINDLRSVLGYDKIDLYGDSYGTRLALTVMRDDPQILRSVILDSVYPLQVNLYTDLPKNAERVFNQLFDGCESDSVCNDSYPDLRTVFYEQVDRLNANPVSIQMVSPITGQALTIHVTGNLLMEVLFTGMYNRDVAAYMPKMIYQVKDDQYTILRDRLGVELTPSGAIGMTMSVQCREEIPFSTSEELRNDAVDVQRQIKDFFPASFLPLYDVCKIWGAGAVDPRENQPVTSDIPALIFAGIYDPVTPPEWGKLAAETLSHSYYYEFPGAGHWVMRSSECSLQIALSFLQDPEQAPDSSCLASENGIQFIH